MFQTALLILRSLNLEISLSVHLFELLNDSKKFVLSYFFYESYTTYQALNLIKDQQIIYEKEGPVEETK